MTLSPQELAQSIVQAAESKKAYGFTVLDIGRVSIIADYFVICSGRSTIQVQAIAEEIIRQVEEKHGLVPRREGLREGRWVLLDYGSVVAHVFLDEERLYYNLERLWGDAPVANAHILP
ncbi:MAG: ribosome silencing factor [Bacillota bacterium]